MLRLCPLIGVVLALLVPASAGAAPLLFVQQTDGGTLQKTGDATYRLTLRGVAPSVSTFADRPGRTAGSERAATFVSRWRGRFGTEPPNAALVIDGAPRGRDVAMLTLSAPRYRPRNRTFTYVARALKGKSGAALKAFHARRDPVRELRFGAASLFVDDASDLMAQQMMVTFSGDMQASTVFGLEITGVSPAQEQAVFTAGTKAVPGVFDLGGNANVANLQVTPSRLTFTPTDIVAGSTNMTVIVTFLASQELETLAMRTTDGTAFATVYQSLAGQNPMPVSRLGSEVFWWVTAASYYGGPAAFGL
ncbi:MAG: hypothetical protein JHC95_14380 [Solirubrobacteraceae bacterium]|nr:hypothetical protein [Solirubrobacteraceae bacterium]